MDKGLMAEGVRLILQGMNADMTDSNFKETPERVARMFCEMLTPPEFKPAIFPARSAELVLLRGHRIFAICPHHLQPVEIVCHIGYVPYEKTMGLSKLARLAESKLTRPILQEDLAALIVDDLQNILVPWGAGVVLVAEHGCMKFRGVKSIGDVVVSSLRGALLDDTAHRHEFLQAIGVP